MARRRQLVVMINAEKQRLAKAQDRIAQRSFKALLEILEAERERIDQAIDKLIEASPFWCAKQDLLKSVPGIGDVVARTLIAELPELGRVAATKSPRLPGSLRSTGTAADIAATQDPGRPRRGPGAALHGLPGRHPPQPGAQVLLSPSARGRQTGPSRPGRCHAQAADHPSRSPAGRPLIVRSIAKSSSMRRTAATASGALRRSASSKNLRRPWLQHAASVIGPVCACRHTVRRTRHRHRPRGCRHSRRDAGRDARRRDCASRRTPRAGGSGPANGRRPAHTSIIAR